MIEHESVTIEPSNHLSSFSSDAISENIITEPNFILVETKTQENETENIVAEPNFTLSQTKSEEEESTGFEENNLEEPEEFDIDERILS
ncbi:MAG: hypothetical protein LBH59_07415, partial [Planctomycetaceae bacterium]|nr:hypothetical protein [Planctomycetaceae bacterium]